MKMLESMKHQAGVMLIEALIAILIFSVGVLGIIGLQGSATKASTDARYRSEAALLANELIGRMWTSDRTQATLQAAFLSANSADYIANNADTCKVKAGANGVVYEQWAWQGLASGATGTASAPAEGTVLRMLPGAATYPPTVVVTADPGTATPSSRVTVIICWQLPGGTAVPRYMTEAQIGG